MGISKIRSGWIFKMRSKTGPKDEPCTLKASADFPLSGAESPTPDERLGPQDYTLGAANDSNPSHATPQSETDLDEWPVDNLKLIFGSAAQ